jgi:hypothetical protein
MAVKKLRGVGTIGLKHSNVLDAYFLKVKPYDVALQELVRPPTHHGIGDTKTQPRAQVSCG